MYNICTSVYAVILPDNILVLYKFPLPPGQLLHLMEIVWVGTELAMEHCQLVQVYLCHMYQAW